MTMHARPLGVWTGLVVLLIASFSGGLLWWFPRTALTWIAAIVPALVMIVVWLGLRARAARRLSLERALPVSADQSHAQLARELLEVGSSRGAQQLSMLQAKRDDLLNVIRARFSENELSFGRYQHAAELVCEAVVDNLRSVTVAHQSVRSIDVVQLEARAEQLASENDEGARSELTAIQRRLELHAEQMKKAQAYIVENEAALTSLANAASSLADSKTNLTTGSASSANDAITALEQMAERAKNYHQR